MFLDCWNIPIDKLMYWRVGSWVKYENKKSNLSLRLHCDQLIITNNNKVLESLNMHGKMKGIYKEDVLILIVCTSSHEVSDLNLNKSWHFFKLKVSRYFIKYFLHFIIFVVQIRKLKFQIKNNPAQHLQKLGEHFVVISHNSGSKSSNLKYRNIEDVFKSVLEDYTGMNLIFVLIDLLS